MKNSKDQELLWARSKAYRSSDPLWWSNLGAIYATRQPPNLIRARVWYQRAAIAGEVQALFEYGLMLIQGEGGPKRPAQGRKFLERAATKGCINARKYLSFANTQGK